MDAPFEACDFPPDFTGDDIPCILKFSYPLPDVASARTDDRYHRTPPTNTPVNSAPGHRTIDSGWGRCFGSAYREISVGLHRIDSSRPSEFISRWRNCHIAPWQQECRLHGLGIFPRRDSQKSSRFKGRSTCDSRYRLFCNSRRRSTCLFGTHSRKSPLSLVWCDGNCRFASTWLRRPNRYRSDSSSRDPTRVSMVDSIAQPSLNCLSFFFPARHALKSAPLSWERLTIQAS